MTAVLRPVQLRRSIRSLAAVALVAFLVTGAATAAPVRQQTDSRPFTFYLIAGLTTDPFYVTMERGARQEARSLGAHLVFVGSPDQFTPSSQIPYVDLAIARHASAILIAPTDRTALDEPLRRATRAGIPVLTVDTSIGAPLAVTRISSRNTAGGAMAARALAGALHRRGSVWGISVRPGVSTTDQRERGFVSALRRYPRIRYLGTRYDNDDPATASSLTSAVLAHHPGLAGIFAMNALSGDGAIASLMRTRMAKRIRVVEFDAEPLQVFTLRRGAIDALIAQDPWTMGALGVKLADRWLSHHRAGIRPRYYTREVVLTRSNVNDPALKHFLYVSP
jgi:ribose transport system substrate-binding protein